MARTILTALLTVLLFISGGCYSIDSGASQLIGAGAKAAVHEELIIGGTEADIIEQMATARKAYRDGIYSLIAHYKFVGNSMMLKWAESELEQLNRVPQYNYIIDAGLAGGGLTATASVTEADYMYADALRLEKKARAIPLFSDDELLRESLKKYNELIKRHPSSDKIDDAAYRAGRILEHFKDYTLAVLYYKRAYQWDPETETPAMFKAAYILDRRMSQKAEALELYQEAVKQPTLSRSYKEFTQMRIAEIRQGE